MYTVPCSNDLLNGIRVPMGLIIQPMASVKSEEVCDSLSHLCVYIVYREDLYVCEVLLYVNNLMCE